MIVCTLLSEEDWWFGCVRNSYRYGHSFYKMQIWSFRWYHCETGKRCKV